MKLGDGPFQGISSFGLYRGWDDLLADEIEDWYPFLLSHPQPRLHWYFELSTDPAAWGFMNGQRCATLLHAAQQHLIWHSRQEPLQPQPNNAPSYKLKYGGFSAQANLKPLGVPMADARKSLEKALKACVAFSKQFYPDWTAHFENGLVSLHAFPMDPSCYGVVPEQGYSDEARMLLNACYSIWCFGGMGSWNDVEFINQDVAHDYRFLTRNLYNALAQSFSAAIDSCST